MKFVAPKSGIKSFTCPHCGVLARQYHFVRDKGLDSRFSVFSQNPVRVSKCEHCDNICLWYFDKMVYPNRSIAPLPNPEMPEEIKKDYEEAASIYSASPRGAAALLRLAIQKLCIHLGGKGTNINDDIRSLVDNGLPEKVQQALDIVRVIGNNAVHPGQIDVDDERVVADLFALINVITEYMISMPKKVTDIYGKLPDSTREHIEKRNTK